MEKNTFYIEPHMVSRFHYTSVGLFLLSAIELSSFAGGIPVFGAARCMDLRKVPAL